MKQTVKLKAHVDLTDIDAAIAKARQLIELLEEANSLVCELASMQVTLTLNI